MENNVISRSLTVTFILTIAAFPLLIFFFPDSAKIYPFPGSRKNLVKELSESPNTISPIPTQAPVFVPSISPTNPVFPTTATGALASSPSVTPTPVSDWTNYVSNTRIENKFSFVYPKDWALLYREDKSLSHRYEFVFHYSDRTQIMTVIIDPVASSIDDFINKNYKTYADKLTDSLSGKIGSYVLYKIFPRNTISPTDIVYSIVGTRGVVLGKENSYVISFNDVGDRGFIDAIEQYVWPTFTFD